MKKLSFAALICILVLGTQAFGQTKAPEGGLSLSEGWHLFGLPKGVYMNISDGSSVMSNRSQVTEVHPSWYDNSNEFYNLSFCDKMASSSDGDYVYDVWAVAFDYDTWGWSSDYLHYNQDEEGEKDGMAIGTGIMLYVQGGFSSLYGRTEAFTADRTINYLETSRTASQGRWFLLSNPYVNLNTSAPESIQRLVQLNQNSIDGGVQGGGIYIWNVADQDYEFKTEGTIESFQGFFVNMADGATTFTHTLSAYSGAKSAEREFVELAVVSDGDTSRVMFAVNESASEGYDIFDANALFGGGLSAKPYLVCEDEIALCKEEVNALPYTASMNIKSNGAQTVRILADRIPDYYTLTLVDGMEEIEMQAGDEYETTVLEGENEDRFSLKIGKNAVSLQDVAKAEELNIVNNNRMVRVIGGSDVLTEVYNALGQKVYETNERTFELSGVAAGAYVVKTRSGNVSRSAKIVIR